MIRFQTVCVGMTLEAVTLLAPLPTALDAAECTDRFPEGRYGIPLTRSPIAFVQPILDGFSPLYVQRLPVAIATSGDCEYVYAGDMFRLVESPTALFAGCTGDAIKVDTSSRLIVTTGWVVSLLALIVGALVGWRRLVLRSRIGAARSWSRRPMVRRPAPRSWRPTISSHGLRAPPVPVAA